MPSRGSASASNSRAVLSILWTVVLAAAGCTGSIDGGAAGASSRERTVEPAVFTPAPAALHRLTRAEYVASVDSLFASGITVPESGLPTDTSLHGFTTIGHSEITITPVEVEQYETAAQALMTQAIDPAHRAGVFGCDVIADAGCLRAFVVRFGRLAWRRALGADEVDQLVSLGVSIGTALRDPWAGAGYVLSAILQSPHFLFRVEIGTPDPAMPGRYRYDRYELASRLSFLLWGGPPDDALLDAAEAGVLDDEAGLRSEAERMLDDDRTRPAMQRFFGEFMSLDRLDSVQKSATLFPEWTPTLRASMRTELLEVFGDVWDRDADVRTLLSTDQTYVDSELAALYGLPDPGAGMRRRTTLPPSARRGGILGRAGFLAMWSHATVTSPTRHGKFILTSLLCEAIGEPPPGAIADLSADPDRTPRTLRQRLEARHATRPDCASCHARIDPLGFPLEDFDAIGRRRALDNGLPIDATAEVHGTAIDGAGELGAVLATDPAVSACFARRMFRYGFGHVEARGELPALTLLEREFAAEGHGLRELALLLVESDAFRFASPPAGECTDGATQACTTGCGAGTATCERGEWQACVDPRATAETCNGTDDDCDGRVDEAISRVCTSVCGAGIETCAAGAFGVCSARMPSAEVCDRVDNSCDGIVDEGFTAVSASTTYTVLRSHQPTCDGATEAVGLGCNSAIHAFCSMAAGVCGTSGFGPVEHSGDGAAVTCVAAIIVPTSYTALAAIHDGCTAATRYGPACNAAIHRRCAALGHVTGYGPVSASGDVVEIACTPNAEVIGSTYTELSSHHGGCTTATRMGGECNAAIHRFCASRGFVSGFGPLENSGDTAVVACVRATP